MRPVRLAALVLAGVLALAGCGASKAAVSTDPNAPLKIGANPVPHAQILEYVKKNLAPAAGLNLQVVTFTDYVQPNVALQDGQLDGNYFQHVPYLTEQKKERGYDFVPLKGIHLEPLGIYSQKVKSLAATPNGAKVLVPNDASNEGRALKLLAANKLLTLKDANKVTPDKNDIAANPKNLSIVELDPASIPRSLQDADLAVINGNYALEAKLVPTKDALALESAVDNPYANLLVVRSGDQTNPRVQKLEQLLHSPQVRKYIEDTYKGAVIPAF